jgi:hypothetical protein
MSDAPWIEWKGGECPVALDTLVHARFRDGRTCRSERSAGWWRDRGSNWRHQNDCDDIIAYRVVSPATSEREVGDG